EIAEDEAKGKGATGSGRWAVGVRSAARVILKLGDQGAKHSTEPVGLLQERINRFGGGYADTIGQDQVCLKLLERTLGDAQEIDVGLLGRPSVAFGDVGRDGSRRAATLRDQTKLFVGWI